MIRIGILITLACLIATTTASAEPAVAKFRWDKGQVLTYKVEHTTTVNELIVDAETKMDQRSQTITKLYLVKRWQVAEVDAMGTATMVMSLSAMKWETQLPDGTSNLFDSAKPDPNHPETTAEMSKFIGPPLVTVRIDTMGKLVEIKENKFGSATRLEADLPFKLTLPDVALAPAVTWDRSYAITLDRTGEKFDAMQKFTIKSFSGPIATVGLTTQLKALPVTESEQVPLLPFQPEGDLYFHTETGRYQGARLKVQKVLLNHQGEGSKYSFNSSYTEDWVPNP